MGVQGRIREPCIAVWRTDRRTAHGNGRRCPAAHTRIRRRRVRRYAEPWRADRGCLPSLARCRCSQVSFAHRDIKSETLHEDTSSRPFVGSAGGITFAPASNPFSRPSGSSACKAVAAAMFTSCRCKRVTAIMRSPSSRRFAAESADHSTCLPSGVSGCGIYGPIPIMSISSDAKNSMSEARSSTVCPGSPAITPLPTW